MQNLKELHLSGMETLRLPEKEYREYMSIVDSLRGAGYRIRTEKSFNFKILLRGRGNTGKTSLVNRYFGQIINYYRPSPGVDFKIKRNMVRKKLVKLLPGNQFH